MIVGLHGHRHQVALSIGLCAVVPIEPLSLPEPAERAQHHQLLYIRAKIKTLLLDALQYILELVLTDIAAVRIAPSKTL